MKRDLKRKPSEREGEKNEVEADLFLLALETHRRIKSACSFRWCGQQRANPLGGSLSSKVENSDRANEFNENDCEEENGTNKKRRKERLPKSVPTNGRQQHKDA